MSKAMAVKTTDLRRGEKFDLLDEESLGQDPEVLPLTKAQREELERRLDELEGEGPIGLSWDEVLAQVHSR